MEFTCAHCGKSILCSGVIVDKKHFVHSKCEAEFIETLESIDELFEEENEEDLTEA